jgi:lysozyme
MNKEIEKHLKRWEGLRLKAYPDPGSKNGVPWTIGYGHTLGVKKGDTCTEAQADQWLKEDYDRTVKVINKYVKVPLTEGQYGALVSFVFNLGEGQFAKSTLLKLLNKGNYEAVPEQLLRFKYNDGKVMQGLLNRRKDEVKLWNSSSAIVSEPSSAPIVVPVTEKHKGIFDLIVDVVVWVLNLIFKRK